MARAAPYEAPRLADTRYDITMRELIGERFGALWRTIPAALSGEDPEGVHNVRVASRRLRAAMDVAVDCFPAPWYKPLHGAVKEITRALGGVRDRDVQLEFLRAERVKAPAVEQPGLDRLIRRTEREQAEARREMLRFFADLERRRIRQLAAKHFGPAAKGRRIVIPSTEAGVGDEPR